MGTGPSEEDEAGQWREIIARVADRYRGMYPPGYLQELREDWADDAIVSPRFRPSGTRVGEYAGAEPDRTHEDAMFAKLLREARHEAGMSQSELAALSGTSRAAIADYEAGRKNPRIHTAERILRALDATLTVARVSRTAHGAVFSTASVEHLLGLIVSPALARDDAMTVRTEILESACAVEGIHLSWGELKALSDGITLSGDPLDVWRATELARSIHNAMKHPGPLRTITGGTLVEADDSAPDGARELRYLVNAIAAGADPSLTLHTVSGNLVRAGMPWLYPQYAQVANYRQALVTTKRTGDGTALVNLLLTSAQNGRTR